MDASGTTTTMWHHQEGIRSLMSRLVHFTWVTSNMASNCCWIGQNVNAVAGVGVNQDAAFYVLYARNLSDQDVVGI